MHLRENTGINPIAAGAVVNAHRNGGRVFAAFGVNFGNIPSGNDVVQSLLSSGTASHVVYVEIWEGDHTVLGTGWNDYWVISVYA